MEVGHCRLDVGVAKQFLNFSDVGAGFKQVRCERMAECVRRCVFVDRGAAHGIPECPLNRRGCDMVASFLSEGFVEGSSGGGEEKLPSEFVAYSRVFPAEGVRERSLAEARAEVGCMDLSCDGDLILEVVDRGSWNDGHAVFRTFGLADVYGPAGQVEVLDSEGSGFVDAEAGAVQKLAGKECGAFHEGEDAEYFIGSEDDGTAFGAPGFDDIAEVTEGGLQDIAIEEDDGVHCLVLGGCGDVAFGCEVGEEFVDVGGAELSRVFQVVEADEAFNPVPVVFGGATSEVSGLAGCDNALVEVHGARRG